MEVLGAVGSVVGIISLGIQIAQILQAQINAVRDADARLLQIVWEVQATASALSNLQDLLLEDRDDPDHRIFSDGGHHDIDCIIRRCDYVFRTITTLIAKTGKGALAKVDEFQRQIKYEAAQRNSITATKLTIDLTNLEHLLWPWKLPKIEQSIADLDRLKASLTLMLAVAMLAKEKKKRLKQTARPDSTGMNNSDESQTVFDGEEENALVDELFYKNLEYNEAEQKCNRIVRAETLALKAIDAPGERDGHAALQLIQRWPAQVNASDVPSVSDLLQLNIVLEAYSIEFDDRESHWIRVPLTLTAIRDKAIEIHQQSSSTLIDTFSQLPMYQQLALTNLLDTIRSHSQARRNQYDHSSPTLLALLAPVRKPKRLKILVGKLFCLACLLPISKPIKPNLFLIVARVVGKTESVISGAVSHSKDSPYTNHSANWNRDSVLQTDPSRYPYAQAPYTQVPYAQNPYSQEPSVPVPYYPSTNDGVPYGNIPYTGAPHVGQSYAEYANVAPHHASAQAVLSEENTANVQTIPTAQATQVTTPPAQGTVTSEPEPYPVARAIQAMPDHGSYSQNATGLAVYQPVVSASRNAKSSQQVQLARPPSPGRRIITSVFGRELMPLPTHSAASISKEEKSSIARYYLEKWTTVFDHLTDDVRRQMRLPLRNRDSRDGNQGSYPVEEDYYRDLGLGSPHDSRPTPPQWPPPQMLSLPPTAPPLQSQQVLPSQGIVPAATGQQEAVGQPVGYFSAPATYPPPPAHYPSAPYQSAPYQSAPYPSTPYPPAPYPPASYPPAPAHYAHPAYPSAPALYSAPPVPISTSSEDAARRSSTIPIGSPKDQDIPKQHITATIRNRPTSYHGRRTENFIPNSLPLQLARVERGLPSSKSGTNQIASGSTRRSKKIQHKSEEDATQSRASNPSGLRLAPPPIFDSTATDSHLGESQKKDVKSKSSAVEGGVEERLSAANDTSAKPWNDDVKSKTVESTSAEKVALEGSAHTEQTVSGDDIKLLGTESRRTTGYEKPFVVEEADDDVGTALSYLRADENVIQGEQKDA